VLALELERELARRLGAPECTANPFEGLVRRIATHDERAIVPFVPPAEEAVGIRHGLD